MNAGRMARRLATVLHRLFPALSDRWLARHPVARSVDVPWAPVGMPTSRARLGLVTTAGVHLAGQPAFDMRDPEGDPGWRALPSDPSPDAFAITHDYYDTRAARRDLDVVFPVRRLRELVAAGRLGALTARHAGLMGHVDGAHLVTLVERTAPDVAALFRDERADIVLLAPA
jgi:D-proline reductase (dithiol) PrdB